MNDDVSALLNVHEYFRGVSEEAVRDVLAVARVRQFAAGDVVHQPEDSVASIMFILRGRLKAVKVDPHGQETLFRIMERGDQMGLMLGALYEPVPVRVFSLEPSTVLEVGSEAGMELTLRYPDLRRVWQRTYATGLKKFFFGAAPNRAPNILALIHEDPTTRRTAEQLLARLRGIGEELAVFSDSPEWRGPPGVPYRPLFEGDRQLGVEEIRQQVAEWQDANRIVFDVQAGWIPEGAENLMRLVDRAVYFVPDSQGESVIPRLRAMDVAGRGWRDKLSLAWVLGSGRTVAPSVPGLHELVCRDFKIAEVPPDPRWGRSLGSGMERLVHELRGVRIGVALGGGAARGMSHLGVLKALEQNGIVVDMIAGTSAGAMSGVVYASGIDADYAANQFSTDLRPDWLFRHLPSGNHWYLLYKYRCGHFDPMLRKYLNDWRLEQLSLPCLSVTVDLVGGTPVVRERGDATHAILESINLPVLSVPIIREGKALIDGGLVNNIPADELVARGCNFVIAVSVTAKMERQFGNIKPDSPPPRKRPSILQTVLRSLLVQNHSLNAIGVGPADVVIEPDVTRFDLTEFMRAKELAATGEAAALDQISKIKHLLTRLDPQLFPAPG